MSHTVSIYNVALNYHATYGLDFVPFLNDFTISVKLTLILHEVIIVVYSLQGHDSFDSRKKRVLYVLVGWRHF